MLLKLIQIWHKAPSSQRKERTKISQNLGKGLMLQHSVYPNFTFFVGLNYKFPGFLKLPLATPIYLQPGSHEAMIPFPKMWLAWEAVVLIFPSAVLENLLNWSHGCRFQLLISAILIFWGANSNWKEGMRSEEVNQEFKIRCGYHRKGFFLSGVQSYIQTHISMSLNISWALYVKMSQEDTTTHVHHKSDQLLVMY